MKQKGYTLIEIVCAIALMLIICTMICKTVFNVIHIFQSANEYKNANDDVFAFIQGNNNANLATKVLIEKNPVQFYVNGKINKATMIKATHQKQQNVSMYNLNNERFKLLQESDYYKNMMDYTKKMVLETAVLIKDKCQLYECDRLGYNSIQKVLYFDIYHQKFDLFASSILPTKLNESMYIRSYATFNNEFIVFLSKTSIPFQDDSEENIHFIYDENQEKWYYLESKDLKIQYQNTLLHGTIMYQNNRTFKNKEELFAFIESIDTIKILDKLAPVDDLSKYWK